MPNPFPQSVGRDLNVVLGERPAVTDFRLSSDDPDDWGPAFNRAAAAAHATGGREVLIPARTAAYRVKTPIEFLTSYRRVYFVGQGDGSLIERWADMPGGQGLFTLRGQQVGLYDISIDGRVMAPTGLRYGVVGAGGDFNDDPYYGVLTRNTSIWVRSQASAVELDGVTVRHTGGYAVLIDAEDGDVDGVLIRRFVGEQNRPHLFGPAGDLHYGSWTGGIFHRGPCSPAAPYRVRNLRVESSKFRRSTGNQVWGHSPFLTVKHENVRVVGCEFEDIGRDGVLIGNVEGGLVQDCVFRRIGYVTRTDQDAPDPQALAGAYAVGLDTSGYARGVDFVDNRFYSVYGGAIDLDGFRDGSVSRNFVDGTLHGAPESLVMVGINWGDTQGNGGGGGIRCEGNHLAGCVQAALRMNFAENCYVAGNTIFHLAAATEAPVQLWAPTPRVRNNRIVDNRIDYSASQYCIVETGVFDTTCTNWVRGNLISGSNLGEFLKHPGSLSFVGRLDSPRPSTALTNVQSAVVQAAAGFIAIGTGDTAAADTLAADWLLLRRNSSSGQLEYSSHVQSGARVWTPLSGGSSAIPSDLVIPRRNTSGLGGRLTLQASTGSNDGVIDWGADLIRMYGAGAGSMIPVKIEGASGQAGLTVANGWVDCPGGFLTASNASNAIQAPNGGVTAASLISIRADGGDNLTMVRSGVRDWRFSIDGDGSLLCKDQSATKTRFRISPGGTAFFNANSVYGLYLNQGVGNHGYHIGVSTGTGPAAKLTLSNETGGALAYWNADLLELTGSAYVSAPGGFLTTNGAANAIQAPNGGVTAKSLISVRNDGDSGLVFSRTNAVAAEWGIGIGVNGFLYFTERSAAFTPRMVLTPQGLQVEQAIKSNVSGAAIGFQIGSGNYQADGNGNVSAAGQANFTAGYTGGAFVGAGVACQNHGVGGAALSVWAGSGYSAIVTYIAATNATEVAATNVRGSGIFEGGVALSTKYALSGHTHSTYSLIGHTHGWSEILGKPFLVEWNTSPTLSGLTLTGGLAAIGSGIAARSFNPNNGIQYTGADASINVRNSAGTGFGTLTFVGGVLVGASGL